MLNGNEMKAFYRIMFPKRDGDGGLTARVPDVNETRLNDNFRTVLDEFRKLWNYIKNGFKTKTLEVEGNATIDGNADIDGNATVGGVLDVTNRRAQKVLSSPGWYRVMTFAGTSTYQPDGATGALVRFNIVVYGSTSVNGNHQIDLSTAYGTGHREFVNELSNGQDTLIAKIRYAKKGNNFYVDVHFTGNSGNTVSVWFDPKTTVAFQARFTSNGLEAVADSPSGETIITTYTFGTSGAFFGDLYTNEMLLLPFLTKGTAIPSNANMNTYTTPGVYYATTAVASTLSNANITAVAFKLIVMPMVGSDVMRIHMADWDNCIIAMRRYNGSTWSGYRRITPVSV